MEAKIMQGDELYRFVRILKDGSLKFKIEKSDFGGRGWFVLNPTKGRLKLVRYDTRSSPLHNLTSCPAHTLFLLPAKKGDTWEEKGESNNFILRSRSKILLLLRNLEKIKVPAGKFKCLEVLVRFDVPEDYTGPHYSLKRYWVAEGVGLVRLEMTYADGKKDVAMLKKFETGGPGGLPFGPGNWWLYEWDCQFGPNRFNIHNTGQEARYKPPKPK